MNYEDIIKAIDGEPEKVVDIPPGIETISDAICFAVSTAKTGIKRRIKELYTGSSNKPDITMENQIDQIDDSKLDRFWNLVEQIGWGTDTTEYYSAMCGLLHCLSDEQAREVNDIFSFLKNLLYRTLDDHEKELLSSGMAGYECSDDSFSDLICHIIGLGKNEFEKCMKNPISAIERARSRNFKESFSYCFPYTRQDHSDFNLLKPEQYIRRAKKYIEDDKDIFEKAIIEKEAKAYDVFLSVLTRISKRQFESALEDHEKFEHAFRLLIESDNINLKSGYGAQNLMNDLKRFLLKQDYPKYSY